MKQKFSRIAIVSIAVLALMFCEYRWIMHAIKPYRGFGGTVYLEVFGQVDEYYADPVECMEVQK